MADRDREARVLDAVVTLVDSLLHDFDVVDLLTDLTERCAQLLDVASAGLLLAGARRQLHLIAATSDRIEEVELFQLQADEGPCLDCFTSGQPVSIADLAFAIDRWPRSVPVALRAGLVSVHAIPMRAAGRLLGALGLFGNYVGELNESDLLVGRSLAHVASVAIVQEHPPTTEVVLPRLRSALARRVVVETGQGLLARADEHHRRRCVHPASSIRCLAVRVSHRRGCHIGVAWTGGRAGPSAGSPVPAAS